MSEEPLYNIGVVTRVTGISIPSLHAWDRRYGFPEASRTAGGHRLYSEKDIARLRWVKSQVDSGMAASRAIIAARSLEAEGRLFLSAAPQTAAQPRQGPVSSNLRDHLLEAFTRHDLAAADRLMGEMLAFYSPDDITLDVIGPVMASLGEAWEQGRITVATEHLASNYLRHRLLMWMVTGPAARPVRPVVLACAPDEWHEGSLLMLGVLLRRQGWPVAYLGQNVPFHDLAKFVEDIHPSLVVLLAMREETARNLAGWPEWIRQDKEKPHITFGGRVFAIQPELQSLVPGIYLGDTLQGGLTRITQLLQGF